MPRHRPADRLDELARAAISVFGRVGFSKALMTDVAAEMGVSAGLLYTYVESKEALFHFALSRAVDDPPADGAVTLPMPTPGPGATADLIAALLRARMAQPRLRAALAADRAVDIRAELEGIVRENYEVVHRCRRLLTMIDRSAFDVPELREQFFVKGRRPLVERLADYLSSRIEAGQLRPVADATVTARFILETVAWFANHRYGDVDGAAIDDAVAEGTVVDMLVTALVGSPA